MTGPAERNAVARWGILGTADIAGKIARAIDRARNAEVAAVASREADRARRWAETHCAAARPYGSYGDLVGDPNVDVVYVPLPPSLHAEWVERAARCGKHVLCEKPLAPTVEDARRAVAACERAGVSLFDGMMWPHHRRTSEIRAVLAGGELGTLRRLAASFTYNWDDPPEGNIRLDPALGGGSLGDLGYYCVAIALWAFESLPSRAFATARERGGVDFNVNAMLWFDGGRTAVFDCGFDTAWRQTLEIAGSWGSVRCDDFVLPHSEESASFQVIDGWGRSVQRETCGSIQEVSMVERVSRGALRGEPDCASGRRALEICRVLDAVRASIACGQVVDVAG